MNAASSWALILGLTIAALFVLAILLDIYCYVKHRNGLLYYFRRTLCGRREDGVVKEKPAANGDNKATDSNSKERSQVSDSAMPVSGRVEKHFFFSSSGNRKRRPFSETRARLFSSSS